MHELWTPRALNLVMATFHCFVVSIGTTPGNDINNKFTRNETCSYSTYQLISVAIIIFCGLDKKLIPTTKHFIKIENSKMCRFF